MRPIVLSIAGSDSSAGAGIQADLKAIEANGGYAATVITAVTAQNTRGVLRCCTLAAELVRAQLDAVLDDLDVAAVKTGMLGDASTVTEVARALDRHPVRTLVCDPILRSSSGAPLLDDEGLAVLRRELLPRTTLLTPNVDEAETLAGRAIRTVDDAARAAAAIRALGAQAVLITGGHLESARGTDLLLAGDGRALPLDGPALPSPHTHGTGCTLAAAIATRLALGDALVEAVRCAKRFVSEAIRHGLPLGRGRGPTDPFFFLERTRGKTAPWELP